MDERVWCREITCGAWTADNKLVLGSMDRSVRTMMITAVLAAIIFLAFAAFFLNSWSQIIAHTEYPPLVVLQLSISDESGSTVRHEVGLQQYVQCYCGVCVCVCVC